MNDEWETPLDLINNIDVSFLSTQIERCVNYESRYCSY